MCFRSVLVWRMLTPSSPEIDSVKAAAFLLLAAMNSGSLSISDLKRVEVPDVLPVGLGLAHAHAFQPGDRLGQGRRVPPPRGYELREPVHLHGSQRRRDLR